MPGHIKLAGGRDVHVRESAEEIFERLQRGPRGLPVRFDVPSGDGTRPVYINPAQVVSFEDAMPSEPFAR